MQTITRPSIIKFFNASTLSMACYTREGSLTNGVWLVYRDHITKAMRKRVKILGIAEGSHKSPSDKNLYPEKAFESSYINCISTDKITISVFYSKDMDVIAGFDEIYISYLSKIFKNFALEISSELGPARIISNKKVVGLLMPIKMGEDELSIVRDQLD